jgi:hypothetical protein
MLAVVAGRRLASLIKARRLQAEDSDPPRTSAPDRKDADAVGKRRR